MILEGLFKEIKVKKKAFQNYINYEYYFINTFFKIRF